MSKRLLIVQFSGDFRAAARLRAEQGTETYYGHGYILDELARLAADHGEAAFMCCLPGPYDERLPSGATVIGAGANPYRDPAPVIAAIERYAPTHLIIHGPMRALLEWGRRRGIPTGCVLADSFLLNPVLRWWRYRWLAGVLNDPAVSLVANHGVNASRGLVQLGVRANKVVPWDFPHGRTPDAFPVKTHPRPGAGSAGGGELLYVGSIERKKGVGDLIAAVARLAPGRDVRLRIAGAGQVDRFQRLARRLGVADRVEFLGLVANADVPHLMHCADAVVVPSRHSFSEGLPLTLYEALASRTPVIASDHPMFGGHLRDGESALVFPAGDVAALAGRIAALLDDAVLYERISRGSADAWQRMQIPVKWGEMIGRWADGGPADRQWLADHALSGSLGAGAGR